MHDEIETLSKVSNTVTQEPVELTVTITPRNRFHRWLQNNRWTGRFFPKKQVLLIHPIYMGTLIRISKLLLTIDESQFDQERMLDSAHRAIEKHGETVIQIIALAIHNRKTDPPASLLALIRDEFQSEMVLTVLMMVLKQMDIQSFTSSIIFMRGLNITKPKKEMSPQSPTETIAAETVHGTSSEALQNIFASQ